MKPIIHELGARVRDALAAIGVDADPLLARSGDPKFGDYQSNAAMGLAKKLGRKPRDVAQAIVDVITVDDLCEPPTIAGPGFINFRLSPSFLAARLAAIPPAPEDGSDRLGLGSAENPDVVVVDLSSPNLAKEMHIGHLRSTVIGDCVARVLEFQGHTVHRENHVGDWGTQFGMLVAYLKRTEPEVVENPDTLEIGDLESFYVEAKALFDADEDFKTESRETVVALQSGDPVIRRIWKAFCDESLRHCHAIYDRLGVRLIDRGESFYNDLMDEVIIRLEKARDSGDHDYVRDSDGALCIFPGGFTTRDGDPLPLLVRKSDGGFNYATSDLATILHRVEQLKATRIIYVVGITQKQHFDMLFAAVRKVGWVDQEMPLEHLAFGNVLASDGRPFKTREGGVVKLKDVLEQAVARARGVIEKDGDLSADQADNVAETVGLAAVKYFDLCHSLKSDYKFNLDHMLAMEGNTAPYMLYAYARIRSIERKARVDRAQFAADTPITIEHPAEIELATKLLQFAEVIETVGRDLYPNVLTDYLFELAKSFSRFYDKKIGVRVIDAPEDVRLSRLRICDLTARVLKTGLRLLGIETIERM